MRFLYGDEQASESVICEVLRFKLLDEERVASDDMAQSKTLKVLVAKHVQRGKDANSLKAILQSSQVYKRIR